MAENLQFLKRRIKSASNIAQIAKAMEMISASKIKKAQSAIEGNKPYSDKISEIVSKALYSVDYNTYNHPYLQNNQVENELLIVFSPDKGLCGSLPTSLMKKLHENTNKNTLIITIGKKIAKFAAKTNGQLVASFPIGITLPKYSAIFPIINLINQYYFEKKICRVKILFAEFKSIFTQSPEIMDLLPLDFSNKINNGNKDAISGYKFEPSTANILEDLLPYYLEVKLYHYFIQAYTSEQASRMVAMQNAKNNALDIADYLTLTYNKARQAKITNELLDLANVQYI